MMQAGLVLFHLQIVALTFAAFLVLGTAVIYFRDRRQASSLQASFKLEPQSTQTQREGEPKPVLTSSTVPALPGRTLPRTVFWTSGVWK